MITRGLSIIFLLISISIFSVHGQDQCITEDKITEVINLLRDMQQSTRDSLSATHDAVVQLQAEVETLKGKCQGNSQEEEDGEEEENTSAPAGSISAQIFSAILGSTKQDDGAADGTDSSLNIKSPIDGVVPVTDGSMPPEAPIEAHPHNCKDLMDKGNKYDGVYSIYVGDKATRVWCDMENGGWTVFQRRFDGTTNFKQNFASYRQGFGNRKKEYWFGLEKLHQMTQVGTWMLRVDVEDYEGNQAYALYIDFKIGVGPGYQLQYRSYSGTAGNALNYNNGQRFSTFDRDQDSHGTISCSAEAYRNGAWWYSYCGNSNLNAFVYGDTETRPMKGMVWYTFKGSAPMKTSSMKMRQM